MKVINCSFAALLFLQVVSTAATIAISIDSGAKSLRNSANVPLSGGNPAVNGDGTQVVMGYFSDATQAVPFGASGANAFSSFTALTGPGTPFGINFTIGDDAAAGTGDGELFKDPFGITTGVADGILPAPGTPLVLRFFNANSTLILDLSNTSGFWNWKAPATPASTLNLNLTNAGLVSRAVGGNNRGNVAAGATTNLLTNNNVVPEPTCALLLSFGLVSLAARRRRLAA